MTRIIIISIQYNFYLTSPMSFCILLHFSVTLSCKINYMLRYLVSISIWWTVTYPRKLCKKSILSIRLFNIRVEISRIVLKLLKDISVFKQSQKHIYINENLEDNLTILCLQTVCCSTRFRLQSKANSLIVLSSSILDF